MRNPIVPAVIAVVLAWSANARAELDQEADRLVVGWNAEYAEARRVRTVFLHPAERRRVVVRQGASRKEARRCTSIVAVAERQVAFRMRVGRGRVVQSQAGVAVVRDCRGRRLRRRVVELTMSRAPGAVELLSVVHVAPLSPAAAILPQRAVGAVGDGPGDTGGGEPDPLDARSRRAHRAAKLDGAQLVLPVSLAAGPGGTGAAVLKLGAGCHRLTVLAAAEPSGVAFDVDAEALHQGGQETISRDRSHAPDARLDFCLGEGARVEVRFAGAPPDAAVTILAAFWPMPAGIPAALAPPARAGMAWALHRRRAPAVSTRPIQQWLGTPGTTVLPLSLEPGACYAAAMALARGTAEGGRLRVRIGADVHFDDAFESPNSAAITFCADTADQAQIVVEVRARSAWWAAAVWRLGDDGA